MEVPQLKIPNSMTHLSEPWWYTAFSLVQMFKKGQSNPHTVKMFDAIVKEMLEWSIVPNANQSDDDNPMQIILLF